MRKLTWAAIGFAAAALLAEYALPVSELPYFAAALALCGLGLLPVRRWKKRFRAAVCLFAGALGLLAWGWHYGRHAAPCEALVGETLLVRALVLDYPEQTERYDRVDVRILEGAPEEKGVLYLYDACMPAFEPGDVISVEIHIASAMYFGDDRSHYFTADGRYFRGYIQDEPIWEGKTEHSWRFFSRKLAHTVKTLCGEIFSPDTAPFMTALLTGDTDELQQNESQYARMRTAGVLHVVAVSGMHLLVLIQLVELFFGRSRRTSILCFPVMVVFVLLAGAGASVVRAAVMQATLLLAPLAEREHDGITGVSAAALGMLIINPMAIGGVGFQLSFACVLGMELLIPPMTTWMNTHIPMERMPVRAVGNSIAASLSAVAFSVPVAAWYFGTIPLLSLPANVLTFLPVEVCFGAGYILCALGAVLPGLAAAGGWVLDWAARWCLWVFEFIGSLPFACLYTEKPLSVCWLVSVYALWLAWYALRRNGKGFSVLFPLSICAIGLGVVFLSAGASFHRGAELTALDVGQGQCVILRDEGGTVVIDCGGSGADDAGDVAANHLLSNGVRRVELLVLTHLHEDHTNGVETLLGRIPVGMLVLPESADDGDARLSQILAAADVAGTDVLCLEEPCGADVGQMSLSLFLPQAGTDANERGIVVLAELGDMTALVMGDAGTDAELILLSSGLLPDVDVLVVGHHGSKTASGALFLRAIQAETAIVSVGDNSYGLPALEVMDILEVYCAQVHRTDEEGSVTIYTECGETDGRIYG